MEDHTSPQYDIDKFIEQTVKYTLRVLTCPTELPADYRTLAVARIFKIYSTTGKLEQLIPQIVEILEDYFSKLVAELQKSKLTAQCSELPRNRLLIEHQRKMETICSDYEYPLVRLVLKMDTNYTIREKVRDLNRKLLVDSGLIGHIGPEERSLLWLDFIKPPSF